MQNTDNLTQLANQLEKLGFDERTLNSIEDSGSLIRQIKEELERGQQSLSDDGRRHFTIEGDGRFNHGEDFIRLEYNLSCSANRGEVRLEAVRVQMNNDEHVFTFKPAELPHSIDLYNQLKSRGKTAISLPPAPEIGTRLLPTLKNDVVEQHAETHGLSAQLPVKSGGVYLDIDELATKLESLGYSYGDMLTGSVQWNDQQKDQLRRKVMQYNDAASAEIDGELFIYLHFAQEMPQGYKVKIELTVELDNQHDSLYITSALGYIRPTTGTFPEAYQRVQDYHDAHDIPTASELISSLSKKMKTLESKELLTRMKGITPLNNKGRTI